MPILRKIISVGRAKVVIIPSSWLKWLEKKYGREPKEVLIEIDDKITITPFYPERTEKEEMLVHA